MTTTESEETKRRAEMATAIQTAFFSTPNSYRQAPSENPDERDRWVVSALQEELRWNCQGRQDRPVLLPCRMGDEELTTWYVCVPSDEMSRALWAEMQAFIGPSYADFGTGGGDFNAADAHATPLFNRLGWRWIRFRAFRRSHEEKIVQQWGTYWSLQERRPQAASYVPKSFNQLRAAFDRALTARDEQAAKSALASLRDRHGLTAENRIFLDIRLAAAFERWSQIAEHRLLSSLLSTHLPAETYGDILEALYEVHLRPFEGASSVSDLLEEFGQTVLVDAAPLFRTKRTSKRPAVLKTFLLHELSHESADASLCKGLLTSLPVGAFGQLDDAIRRHISGLTSSTALEDAMQAVDAEQFDRAFELLRQLPDDLGVLRALLRCVREIEDPAKAKTIVERILKTPESLQTSIQTASPKTWMRVLELATTATATPNSLLEQLKWQTSSGESVEQYVIRWREVARSTAPALLLAEPGLPEGAADYLTELTIGHPDVFEQVYPLWHELFIERAGPQSVLIPVSMALLETLRARDILGDPELALLRDTLLCLVRSGADTVAYRHAIEEVCAVFAQVRSPQATTWGLDVCDGLAIAPARDPNARLSLISAVVQAGVEFYPRLGPLEHELLQLIAGEAGIELNIPSLDHKETETESIVGPEFHIGLYSLDTEASRRARVLLEKLYPNIQVECNADEVCTPKLKALAHGSDIFVFSWKSSKHAAYYCVKASVLHASNLVMAAGAGTTSLVRAAGKAIGGITSASD